MNTSGTRATARPRSRRGLIGLLTSQAISLTGTRISAIALPWFVLVSTGSATRTGMVAFCEMAPYVVVKALTGPLVDRLGPRRVNVTGDLASAAVVGAIPLLHTLGLLHFGVLLALVALLGALRGPADSAKEVLIPDIVADAQVPTERVTGLTGTIERLASTIGPAVAGAIVGLIGPLSALVLDSVSFALSAVIIATTAPRRHVTEEGHEEESVDGYVHQLREGFDYLRRERLLRSIIGMVAVTNLLDAAMFAVLVPVWARDSGRGPAAVGLVAAVMSAFAVGGSLLAATFAHRLPRRTVYLLGYFIAGAPRFVALALGAPIWLVLGVHAVAGFGSGFLNPIIGAVVLERIPRRLLGRVNALADAVCWAGIPFGGVLGGALIGLVGLSPVMLVFGGIYFLATTLPGLRPEWHELDRDRSAATTGQAEADRSPAAVGPGPAAEVGTESGRIT
ncbi:MFS transporter [Actinopolymorpha sp. NPDC004070]|uniref:MFS transporter n=1 Tax=Actinopolymorpha sp. NPDC004070 TaxID=3154548 RepID=UPI0033B7AB92